MRTPRCLPRSEKEQDRPAFSTTGVRAAEAVETGQPRGLRGLSIFLDLNKVTEHAESGRRDAQEHHGRDRLTGAQRGFISGGLGKKMGSRSNPSNEPMASARGVD